MWGWYVFSFFHFSFSFPWKSSDHNRFQCGWNFDIDCQQGSKLSATNFTALKKENECGFDLQGTKLALWPSCLQGSCKLGNCVHACFRVARESRGSWSLALRWQGSRLQGCLPLFGVHLPASPPPHPRPLVPFLHCAPVSHLGYQQSSTWGQCQVCNRKVFKFKKNGSLKARIIVQKHLSFCSFQLELLLF